MDYSMYGREQSLYILFVKRIGFTTVDDCVWASHNDTEVFAKRRNPDQLRTRDYLFLGSSVIHFTIVNNAAPFSLTVYSNGAVNIHPSVRVIWGAERRTEFS